jgi:hypothetical protein
MVGGDRRKLRHTCIVLPCCLSTKSRVNWCTLPPLPPPHSCQSSMYQDKYFQCAGLTREKEENSRELPADRILKQGLLYDNIGKVNQSNAHIFTGLLFCRQQ